MDQSAMNVAVVGCGLLARGTHIPNLVSDPGFELRLLCDIDGAALAAARKFAPDAATTGDFNDVFSDPDIDLVVVATKETFRLPLYRAAIRHRKPLYAEKPLAATLEECRVAAEELAGAGLPFCIGHNRRCSPAMMDARDILRRHRSQPNPCLWRFDRPGIEQIDLKGQGDTATMLIRLNDDWHSWKAQHLAPGTLGEQFGGLLMEMTHFVDLARWFLGSEAERVVAMCDGPLSYTAAIAFEDKSMATIVAGSNGTFGYPKELVEVMANGGTLVVDHMVEMRAAGIPGAPMRKAYPLGKDRYPEVGKQGGLQGWLEKKAAACAEAAETGDPSLQVSAAAPDKGHLRMLGEFAREIRGEREPVSPALDGYAAARVCFASIRSAQEGRAVTLSEMD